ncbi:MAG: alpha-amylase family glycosyl hydrolase [Candidatus Nanopelagicales bacterium]
MIPTWLDGLTWWHVYPLGFSGAEQSTAQAHGVIHRLRHLANWLDYASGLGCRGLQLGPIFASQTHGYDTTDHLQIDHRLGDDADFDALVAGCRQRGLRLLLDGVFNHVGEAHTLFQVARAAGPHPTDGGAHAARWFRLHWPEGGGEPTYDTFEGHGRLVALNHDEPEVADYVVRVMTHWLARGADGWRLDAAYAVPPTFWRGVVDRVRQQYPDCWFVGEVIHGEPADYLSASGLDAVTAYGLWRPLWRSMNEANMFDLAWQVERLAGYAAEHPPMTFVGNHDVTRLASNLTDQRHFGHAIAALFTLPGVPSIYYGDEQAFRGIKEERYGGDDAIRPMFPDRPDGLAPWGWPIYHLHRRLIEMRSRNPWLTHCRASVDHLTNTAIALGATPADSTGRRITALLNIADDPVRFPLGLASVAVEVQSDDAAHEPDPLVVPGHTWRVLSHDR